MTLRYSVWFSANHTTLIDRAIISSEARYEPDDIIVADRPLPSHCWDQWEDQDTGKAWAVEAIPMHTRRFDPAEKRGQIIRGYLALFGHDQAFAAWAVAQTQIGRLYNLVGVGATYLLIRFHLHTAFRLLAFAALYCSQRILEALHAVGARILPDLDPATCTPARLEYALARAGWPPLTVAAATIEDRAAGIA